jgi:hypothetical protein
MSKRFTPEYRSTVLQLLDSNRGNIPLTAKQAGIAERTLYAWKRERLLLQQPQIQQQNNFLPLLLQQAQLQQTAAATDNDESEAESEAEDPFDTLRNRLMQNLLTITESLELNIESRSLGVRVNAIKTLLNSLMELSSQVYDDSRPHTIQIEYVDVDGKTYDAPPWTREDDYKELEPLEDEDDDDGSPWK